MKKKQKRILWITDPWNTLDHPRDTTLRWAQEAFLLKKTQFWCDVKSIRLEGSRVVLDANPILGVQPERTEKSFTWGTSQIREPSYFDQIHYRTDPPVDLAYLHPLQLLEIGLRDNKNTEVVNPLEILLKRNEKTEASCLKNLMPPSLVSSQWPILLEFGKKLQRTVLKPIHEAQSHGIELLDWRTPDGIDHAKTVLEHATSRFQVPVMLQCYLEGIANGEIRLWFLNGKPLACAKKLPVSGDFRVDIDRGSQLTPVHLTQKLKTKADQISKHLKQSKIKLAAVDLIDGYVTDFNFTSPGLITQMETILGENLSRVIVQAL